MTTCTALVLSGGGSNGAWEAGVFWGLTHYGNPEDFKYDVLSGVSAGSINTGFIVGTAIGNEVQASEYLSDLWANMKNEYIYTTWPGGPIRWLLREPSIFDNSPSVDFANTMIAQFPNGIQRMFNMGAVNVGTGEFHNFTEKNTSLEELPDAVISSSSVPGAFPPHYYKGNYYMDGMTAWNTNMSSAITRCLEIVDDESQITVDTMITSTIYDVDAEEEDQDSLHNWLRARQIHGMYVGDNAIDEVMRAYPGVNYRYLFQQKEKLTGMKELTFYNETTWDYQMYGRRDAQEGLDNGPGYGFTQYLADKVANFF